MSKQQILFYLLENLKSKEFSKDPINGGQGIIERSKYIELSRYIRIKLSKGEIDCIIIHSDKTIKLE